MKALTVAGGDVADVADGDVAGEAPLRQADPRRWLRPRTANMTASHNLPLCPDKLS
jgi:hypothetical protein